MPLGEGKAKDITPDQQKQAAHDPPPAPPAVMPCQKHWIVFKFIREKTNVVIPGVETSVEQTKGTPLEMPASDDKGLSRREVGATQPFGVIEAEAGDVLFEVVGTAEEAIPDKA